MARTMRMPNVGELRASPTRDFVELLFHFYRRAQRPTLRKISDGIEQGNFRGTASTETIRKMLRGTTVPAHWETAETVLLVLCDLANVNPEAEMDWLGLDGSARWHLERLWHEALDNPTAVYRRARDPWEGEGDMPF
jgi:hypothetical protein